MRGGRPPFQQNQQPRFEGQNNQGFRQQRPPFGGGPRGPRPLMSFDSQEDSQPEPNSFGERDMSPNPRNR